MIYISRSLLRPELVTTAIHGPTHMVLGVASNTRCSLKHTVALDEGNSLHLPFPLASVLSTMALGK